MGRTWLKEWGKIDCFLCTKLIPRYAPGTMMRERGEETLFLCSRCHRKLKHLLTAPVVEELLVKAELPKELKRVVEA